MLAGRQVTFKCKICCRWWLIIKEAVQQLEGDRRDGEEIHGRDRFAMMAKKGQPASGKFWISGCSLHPTGDAALRDIETEHEQFTVDAGAPQVGFSAIIRKIRSELPSTFFFYRPVRIAGAPFAARFGDDRHSLERVAQRGTTTSAAPRAKSRGCSPSRQNSLRVY